MIFVVGIHFKVLLLLFFFFHLCYSYLFSIEMNKLVDIFFPTIFLYPCEKIKRLKPISHKNTWKRCCYRICLRKKLRYSQWRRLKMLQIRGFAYVVLKFASFLINSNLNYFEKLYGLNDKDFTIRAVEFDDHANSFHDNLCVYQEWFFLGFLVQFSFDIVNISKL